MGLAISVGYLDEMRRCDEEGLEHFQTQFNKINAVLADNGLPPHEEPVTLPKMDWRGASGGFPYGFLHNLRRAYCCVVEGVEMRTGDVTKADDAFILDVTVTIMDSHLLSHSDCEGYYVPMPLNWPLCDNRLPGGFLGSSLELKSELIRVAPALGITLDGDTLSDAEAARLVQIDRDEADVTPLWRECLVWFSLFEACRLSIAHNTLIVFH